MPKPINFEDRAGLTKVSFVKRVVILPKQDGGFRYVKNWQPPVVVLLLNGVKWG